LFTSQWNIENFFAPLAVMLTGEILMWFFVQIVEHIKKPHFFIDKRDFVRYPMLALQKSIRTFYDDVFSTTNFFVGGRFYPSQMLAI
jgi:hypothetical protein